MARTRSYRWVCPLCGAGKLAPSRPRQSDARRYCLACTSRTGQLVERTCPVLDSKRTKATQRRQESAKRKRTSKAVARTKGRERTAQAAQVRDYPLRRAHELAMVAAVELFPKGSLWPASGDIVIKAKRGPGARGTAWPASQRMEAFIGLDWLTDLEAQVIAVNIILHELAHLAAPPDECHGPRWRALFLGAIERLTGHKPPLMVRVKGKRIVRAQVDQVAKAALRQAIQIEGRMALDIMGLDQG